ncbi:MAG: universal stress protein [Candidatus Nitricoxidivorans perseverans]|uniref:Universal stress protein n=1 Tax=Candidatus Nitricoxidivorans perseverans TaxID=2975601 RepID=A0AA49FN43_9PROT|nr:MAG: universal stress protein [Candidatus Nitricoxidivorans perseverans]
MNTLKRILAATDFSRLGNDAVRRATLLAAREGAELLVVHTFPRLSALEAAFGLDDKLPTRLRAAAEANIDALVEAARTAGVGRVRAEIVEGSAHRAVADAAETFRPDLVVIGAHGKGAVQQFFLGGTAARILAQATCPVLVARQPTEGDYRRALAAVDLGPRSEAVLRAALVVAAPARVTVLHAYQAPFEAKLRYKGFPEEDILRYAEVESRAARRNMDALLADPELAGLDIERRIVHGDPNPALPDAARDMDADLIAVGKHGGSRIGEAVMGSVSRFLAYYAPCDVLVV